MPSIAAVASWTLPARGSARGRVGLAERLLSLDKRMPVSDGGGLAGISAAASSGMPEAVLFDIAVAPC